MTTPDHPSRRSSRKRSGSARPTPTRPAGRRSADRRPWPTAPTTTRPSPGKPAARTSHSTTATPIPATVWPAGPSPIDLNATWPAPIVERIVTAFSTPGARVMMLPWPTPHHDHPALAPVGPDGVIHHAPDAELADAVHAVERLGRAAQIDRVPRPSDTGETPSAPFWADLIANRDPTPATPASGEETGRTGSVDLIISSVHPEQSGGGSADLVALYAARRLRVGGILAVLTHSDWTTGQLSDPTSAVVTAGQNADLLYLQHIVALHAPVRHGRFHLSDDHRADTRARHRAEVRGLPAPHHRIHSDVLVFAQPQSPVGSGELKGLQDEPTGGLPRSSGAGRPVREELGEASS
ncbi:hypothetical protein [Amycolatopsis thermoflava]|uniref:hypothetical protein n=1 Tax=Amycolatopsis thermoflava TaxID=84480 RepID=UPI00381E14CF